MIRKADTVKYYELRVSNRVLSFLSDSFGTIDQIIKEGRKIAYFSERNPNVNTNSSSTQLVNSLRELNLVRPATDFTMTINIGKLYSNIFPVYKDIAPDIGMMENREYENFQGLSYENIEKVKNSLKSILTKDEYAVISTRYGLEDSNMHSQANTSRILGITTDTVMTHEIKANFKIKASTTFPRLICIRKHYSIV